MTRQRSQISRHLTESDYMRFLIDAGELLSSSLDYRKTLRNVCTATVETVADICILDVGSNREIETVGAAHRMRIDLSEVTAHLEREDGRPAHPVCKVLDSGQTLSVPDISAEWIDENASNTRHAEFMRRLEYRSMLIVPVRSQIWGVTGALTLVRTGPHAVPYDEASLAFAQDLGRRCGIAIGKARLHSQTLDIAERLQKAALPQTLPEVEGLRFDALYEPADAALLVGGDWYDVFRLEDGRIGISIGDVSGHGIESAAQMSSIRNAIRMGVVMEPDLSIVVRQDDYLFRNEVAEGTYCTALIAILDHRKGKLTYASAGHASPAMWTRGRAIKLPHEPSLPLAFGELWHAAPTVLSVDLEPGCTLVFYTDGLIEAKRSAEEGERILLAALEFAEIRNARAPARALRDACVQGAHADDIAVLVVRYERY